MFDHVAGLRPEEAARWTALVEQCRPVLAGEGMEAVQDLLAERGMSVIQSIAITRAVLGWQETSLRIAIDIVATSAARTTVSDSD
ncbi:hypothetical protein AQF52_0282 [Streptomyces venezuelae]|uniref:hypothetical protein n=1 Tax=Streptomyces gardneri TaxID=66892 RepID=UPI0006BC78AC|nr:hypothetical protein [Streptomyces gardneri]ALO05882.1 hypothetical protein AQF52_0282 [Streptomyces venezuelae]QPK43407.1 hypothetical protein H4W23_01340 [Streptomyces gardneri]WRK34633.1 hypothetical protein U0M97_01345 [Streptomyces venezuelae]CUM43901.1 hypothetical protein BN2537_16767 [Streptomyces venezuelae]